MRSPKFFKFSFPSGDPKGIAKCAYDKAAIVAYRIPRERIKDIKALEGSSRDDLTSIRVRPLFPTMKSFLCIVFGFLFWAPLARGVEKTGTGFAISSNLVLTAYHVVESGTDMSVSFGDVSYPAVLSAFNKDLDWALLKISGITPAIVHIGHSSSAQLADEVYTLGYPATDLLGNEVKFAKGEIGSLSGLGGSKDHFQISVPIQPGNSGGPLFSNNGQVIGVVVATVDPGVFFNATSGALPQNVNYALKIDLIPNLPQQPSSQPKQISVAANQDAICLVQVKVPRTSIRPPTPKPPPRVALPEKPSQDEYEIFVQSITTNIEMYISKLTGFSPENFCSVDGVPSPILTDEEANSASIFLDSTLLELNHFIETSKKQLVDLPSRKEHFKNPYLQGLEDSEIQMLSRCQSSGKTAWMEARNRLADYFNELMRTNGQAEPSSFWKISLTPQSFAAISDWHEWRESIEKPSLAEIGAYNLPTPFWGVSRIWGLRSKWHHVPLGIQCSIPVFKPHSDIAKIGDEDRKKANREIQRIVRTFEQKYSIRFKMSTISNGKNIGGAYIGDRDIQDMIPAIATPVRFFVHETPLYFWASDSVSIFIRGFEVRVSPTTYHCPQLHILIFVCKPNWREILDEESYQLKQSETEAIEVDETMIDAL